MRSLEHRKNIRVDTANLLAYTCRNDENELMGQGMGRTLNVSESGILLETHAPMETRNTISLSIGFKGRLVDISGKILWCRPDEKGMFLSGIEFTGDDGSVTRFLQKYVEKVNGAAAGKITGESRKKVSP